MPFRYDRFDIKGKVVQTDEGFILASDTPIATIGIYKYRQSDGTIRSELVDEETLSNVDSNESLKLKPVTNTHPQEKMVNLTNSKRRTIGSVGETVKSQDGFLTANFIITDSETIKDINKGRKQLSPAYQVDLVMIPGEFDGQHYDAIQRNRKYNHLAIVDNARGGDRLRLNIDHTDSGDAIVEGLNNINEESRSMATYKIDSIDYEAAPEVVNHISKLVRKNDSLATDVKTSNGEVSKLQAKFDTSEEKVKELEKRDSKEEIENAVKVRISLEKNAIKVLGDEKYDGVNNQDLMKKVILKKCPDANLDGKDEVYIEARYDAVVETIGKDAFSKQQQKTVENNGNNNNDGDRIDSDQAHDKMVQDNRNESENYRKNYFKGVA